MQVLDKNGILCMCGEGKFPARILRGNVWGGNIGEEMFSLEKVRNWRRD